LTFEEINHFVTFENVTFTIPFPSENMSFELEAFCSTGDSNVNYGVSPNLPTWIHEEN